MTNKPSGYVIYRGPSMLDGAPIVAIATMHSENRKTGDMVQTWILRDDMSPTAASAAGADASICGDCPQRWHLGGACYVNVGQGPGSIWRAYKRGRYQDATARAALTSLGHGQKIRLGAYGDPAAAPLYVWQYLLELCEGHTGYTHQWRHAPALRDICMASVDSTEEWAQAQRDGWRTFRITGPADILEPGEFLCPSESSGRACVNCLACDGVRPAHHGASVAITVHGSLASRFKVRAIA